MVRILVTAATRHGATAEIGGAIADTLRQAGLPADYRDPQQVDSLDAYDAVVLGSAVYMGQWLPAARKFVDRHEVALAAMPTWLFSSGPIGSPQPMPAGDPVGIVELMGRTKARGHQVFTGRLDRTGLSLGQKVVTAVLKAPEGDFRDWAAIRQWANEVGSQVPAALTASAPR